MEFKILFAPRALDDLKKIELYLRKQGADDPEAYRRKLFRRPFELVTLPSRGGSLHHDPNIRCLIEGSYLIVYRIIADKRVVKVLRYWHSARDVRRLRI